MTIILVDINVHIIWLKDKKKESLEMWELHSDLPFYFYYNFNSLIIKLNIKFSSV